MNDFTIVDKVITIASKRGGGKTEMMKYLWRAHKHLFDKTFVLSGTETLNGAWAKEVGEGYVKDDYNEAWVMKLLEKMKAKNMNKTAKDPNFKRVCLILDDLVSEARFHSPKIKSLKIIVANGRHYGLTLLISTQHFYAIPPIVRTNSDYFLVGRQTAIGYEAVCKEFRCGMSKEEFNAMLEHETSDYKFLLINNVSSKSSDIDSLYAVIRVPDVK